MRIRRPISRESGEGRLLVGGVISTVSYEVITWGTFEDQTLCLSDQSGAVKGGDGWPSGVAVLQLQDGEQRRILLRKCGTFAMCR